MGCIFTPLNELSQISRKNYMLVKFSPKYPVKILACCKYEILIFYRKMVNTKFTKLAKNRKIQNVNDKNFRAVNDRHLICSR